MKKVRLATVWLDGCSGCHMSFLDMDERLLGLADKIDLVYSPLVDRKEFPDSVDAVIIEGAVSSEEDLRKLKHVRARATLLVALGDCSVSSNVPSMRNQHKREAVLARAYIENAQEKPHAPLEVVPLLPQARALHEFVKVDVFVPGCPPSADAIHFAVSELLEGRIPNLEGKVRFG
jgi:NAD-reducing hydrogenase small subunit